MSASAEERTAAELALQRLNSERSQARAVVQGLEQRLNRVHEDSVVPYANLPDPPLLTASTILLVIEIVLFVTICVVGWRRISPMLLKILYIDVIAGVLTFVIIGILSSGHEATQARWWSSRKAEADEQLSTKIRAELSIAKAEVERVELQIARNRAIVDG